VYLFGKNEGSILHGKIASAKPSAVKKWSPTACGLQA
jgi:hypothetical protein